MAQAMLDAQPLRIPLSETMLESHIGMMMNRLILRTTLLSMICLFLTLGAGHVYGEPARPFENEHLSIHPVLDCVTSTPDANPEHNEVQEDLNRTMIRVKKFFKRYVSSFQSYTTLNYNLILSKECHIGQMSLSLILRTTTPTILLA